VNRLEPACIVIEEAQVVMHEADQPYSIAHFLDTDVLSGELAEVDLALAKADAPAVGNRDGSVMKRILELSEPAIGAR
jgi:hypothetical protein